MDFQEFFRKCQSEPTVSDFESYLGHCIFQKRRSDSAQEAACTLEDYSRARDLAFEQRDEEACKVALRSCRGCSLAGGRMGRRFALALKAH